jgi:hypothetical protein
MIAIKMDDLARLTTIESFVHYGEPPPPERDPFVVVRRPSPILLSAPHGAITRRNNEREEWHDEDDYTAGLALLISELCAISAMATIWRTDDSDPNYHEEARSPYKRALKRLVQETGIRWVIDLHGAADASMAAQQWVDLGTRRQKLSLPRAQLEQLTGLIERRLGAGTVSHNVFPAWVENRTITAYCHDTLGIHAVQVELKSAVRATLRRTDSTAYADCGPFCARPENVMGLMQAIVDFVECLLQI